MSRAQNPALRWYCGEGSPERPFPYDCRPYTAKGEDGIRAIIDLPFCWDGANLDSTDHFSHVIYSDPNDTTTSWLEIRPCVSLEDVGEESQEQEAKLA